MSTFQVKAKVIDEDKWVEGYFVAPRYILGHIVESTDEYIVPEHWTIIDVKTIQEVDAI